MALSADKADSEEERPPPQVLDVAMPAAAGTFDMELMQQFFVEHKTAIDPKTKLEKLKEQREKLKKEKQQVVMQMRNENRRRARIKSKANKLSAADLVEVLAQRVSKKKPTTTLTPSTPTGSTVSASAHSSPGGNTTPA
jgi:hypothetical protein